MEIVTPEGTIVGLILNAPEPEKTDSTEEAIEKPKRGRKANAEK